MKISEHKFNFVIKFIKWTWANFNHVTHSKLACRPGFCDVSSPTSRGNKFNQAGEISQKRSLVQYQFWIKIELPVEEKFPILPHSQSALSCRAQVTLINYINRDNYGYKRIQVNINKILPKFMLNYIFSTYYNSYWERYSSRMCNSVYSLGLLNLYGEMILRYLVGLKGMWIRGVNINSIRLEHDTLFIAILETQA